MFEKTKSVFRKLQYGAVGVAACTGLALAQSGGSSYDTSAVTTQITAAVVAILAIGAAVVAGPKIAVKVWKWVGRAL